MKGVGLNTVAIVDDEADVRAALQQMLELEGLRPIEFADAEAALVHLDTEFPGVVLGNRNPDIEVCRGPDVAVMGDGMTTHEQILNASFV